MEYKMYHWFQQLWNETFQLFKINWSPLQQSGWLIISMSLSRGFVSMWRPELPSNHRLISVRVGYQKLSDVRENLKVFTI